MVACYSGSMENQNSKQNESKLTVADWVKIRALIEQAVTEAYAEATNEEIYQKVIQPLIDARNGLVGIVPTEDDEQLESSSGSGATKS